MKRKKYEQNTVQEIFAKEGWTVVSLFTKTKDAIYIYNPNKFDGYICKTTVSIWLNGHRPNVGNIVNKESYIRGIFRKEGWKLISKYKDPKSHLYITKDDFLNGFACKVTLNGWLSGNRPSIQSVVNQADCFASILESEGWEIISGEYHGITSTFIVKNQSVLSGHPCKTNFNTWVNKGIRPNIRSLVNPEKYVSEIIGKEDWILLSKYNSKQEIINIKHPIIFDGHVCKFRLSNWVYGDRPDFKSLENKNKYISYQLAKKGWELLSDYKGSNKELIIRHPNKFNGYKCKTTWNKWSSAGEPSFLSIIEIDKYCKEKLLEKGFIIKDTNWKYSNKTERFYVKYINSSEEYSISWSDYISNRLPKSPKYIIKNSITGFLVKRKYQKNFNVSDIFLEEYWEKFNKKFPEIPEGFHIDHIIPMSWWENNWEQMRLANDPANLRLLPAKENIARGNRLRASELDEYDLWDLYYQAENPMGYELIEDRYDLVS